MDKIVGVGKERIGKDGKKRILVYWRPAKGKAKIFRWVQAETRSDAHYKRQDLMAKYDGNANGSSLPADFGRAQEELKRTLEADGRPKKTIDLYDGTFTRLFIDFKKVYETKHKVVITSPLQIDSSYIHEFKDYFSVDLDRKDGWRAELIRVKSIIKKLKVKKLCTKELLYDTREELPTPESNEVPYEDMSKDLLDKLLVHIKRDRPDYYKPIYFMRLTGRRPQEVTFYEKRDVRGGAANPQELHIRKEIAKSKRNVSNIIYLHKSPKIQGLIRDALRGNDTKWLFPNRCGRRCQDSGIYKYLIEVSEEILKRKISARFFRKRHFTKKIPMSPKDALAIAGSTDIKVALRHYAQTDPESQAKVLEKDD